MGCWKDTNVSVEVIVAGGGERKTVACLRNYGSFSVARLWRAGKWVARNEARGINQSPYELRGGVCLRASELF